MGIRIHKAIGWGMKADVFAENVGFEVVDDDLNETLWAILQKTTKLVVPERSVVKIFGEWRGFIGEPNLLAKDFTFNKPTRNKLPNADDLHVSVSNGDDPVDVHLFLPSALHLNLHRRDDTLDYVESTHDLATGAYREPCEYVLTELKQNPYPWNQQFMDPETGEQVQDPFGDEKDALVPQVPPEVRWWLTETGILKPGAWKLLRPYYAKWWI